jgi:hypothetical protein
MTMLLNKMDIIVPNLKNWNLKNEWLHHYHKNLTTYYKFPCKKVVMGNWIPLEMSLVGFKDVAI